MRTRPYIVACFFTLCLGASYASAQELDTAFAERFGNLALACVHQEYPNKIAHVMQGDADARPPRELTPAFYGCYDWHSAVHGHWLLVRLARTFPEAAISAQARQAVDASLQPEKIAAEVAYLEGPGRVSFERPYGLAWLLQLAAEIRAWDDPQARQWESALAPLEQAAATRIREWLPKLTHPIRIGEHAQTAFAFGLIFDWAREAGDREMASLLRRRSHDFYRTDRGCPLDYEPSGHDFLSPCLAEADLMRRLLGPRTYAAWLGAFLPQIPHDEETVWLEPAVVSDPGDPKLAHLDGLNLSRAWMLEGIIAGLQPHDPRLPALLAAARRHREAGLQAVTGAHYEGGHWLGSFAMYLVTGRGGGNVLIADPFDVIYRDTDRQTARDVVVARAIKALHDVTDFLGVDYDGRITLDISREHGIPYQAGNKILVPASRLLDDDGGGGISVVHEITHVVAASAYRPDRFYDDGLAVYLQAELGTASSYPNFGRDLHQETARFAAEQGGYLPLAETEATRQRSRSGDARRLAYLQEGSFCRFLIERDGLGPFMRVYNGETLEDVYGVDLATLEAQWQAFLAALPPAP